MVLRVPQVMLARAADVLPAGPYAYEAKWDGFRCLAVRPAGGRTRLLSRKGTDLTRAFSDIAAAVDRDLPGDRDEIFDGELVVFAGQRLDFSRLQKRLSRRGAALAREMETPAHYVVFDVLAYGEGLTALPYRRRRDQLERVFRDLALGPPLTLCPMTLDRAEAQTWMAEWAAVGIEGCVAKALSQKYEEDRRGWIKVRQRTTHEAIVGAVTGTVRRPAGVLLGRYDSHGRLRYAGRSVPLAKEVREDLAERLVPAADDHPWTGYTFSAAWGSREVLHTTLVMPDIVAEFSGDTAVDQGRWRHPVRLLRLRVDLEPADVPGFGS
ncbi:ATP-dependent DNA ligase [Streptomyces caniferus]|uniref:ATP-dependent DNA ligase n=1 Tax=Streptomyces caniferus TaxID=285557 RepID=UPI003451D577